MAEIYDLNLVVDEERIKDMELETFYNLEGNSPKATVDFVAHFVTVDGDYTDKETAVKMVITGRKIRDVEEIMEQLKEAMEEQAVPKE